MGEQADMQKVLSLGIPTVVSNYYSRRIDGPINIVTDHHKAEASGEPFLRLYRERV